MAKKLTPEERLQKYKEYLAKLAESEGRVIPSLARSKTPATPIKTKPPSPPKPSPATKSHAPSIREARELAKPPPRRQLVSPAKKELAKVKTAIAKGKIKPESEEDRLAADKKRIRFRVRERAIASGLNDIKRRRQQLERKFERGLIDRVRYQRELTDMVREGHRLLQEKEEITKELMALGSD